MNRSRVSLAVLLCTVAGLATPLWAQQAPAGSAPAAKAATLDAALPTDQRLVTGELPNGLKYIVRQHNNPPARAGVWLHISTGSLNETDRQRGIAHYLEHMAFNGSKNFAPGTVISFFQSLGLNFGQHQNAFTSFDQTSYQLFLPDNSDEKLNKALLFMSDVGGRLLLPSDEIEAERQVILEERRTRLSGRQRVQDVFFEQIAPGSIFGQRLPIGIEETIKGVQVQDFKDYYTKYYVPSNMTLMVVADRDPAGVVEAIKANFSDLGGGVKAPKPVDQETGVKPYTEVRAIVASDKELTDASVGMIWIYPPEAPTTTVGLYRRDLVDSITTWVFNRRIQQKVAEGKVAFLGGGASADDFFRAGFLASATVRGEPEKWDAMLNDLAIEMRRANLHGFTEQEVADARKELLAGAERFVETEKTMPAQSMLALFNGAIADGQPIMSAQQELELHQSLLPTITAAEVSARFNQVFAADKPLTFSLQLPSTASVPTEAELISLGSKALEAKPDAEAKADRPTALLSALPTGGKLAESAVHQASNATTAWLDNGIAVNYRFMDYRKDSVSVSITLATGEILEDAATRGLTQAAALAWARPATSTLTSTNIRDLMTGKKVGVSGRPGLDAVTLTVSGSPTDLETGMQLAYLMLTDPVIERAGFDQWKTQQNQGIAMRRMDTQFYALTEILPNLISPKGEWRLKPLTKEQVDAVTIDNAQKWLREKILPAPIEVAVVGDIEQGKAMELVQRYLGSLPKRDRVSNTLYANLRTLDRPQGPLVNHATLATKTDKSMVGVGFFSANLKDLTDHRRMQVASRILTTRTIQQIREEKALAYSPTVGAQPGVEFPGYGLMVSVSSTAADKVKAYIAAMDEIYADFAKNGPTSEEMETVRKQFANTWDEQMREPGYWSRVLGTLNYRWQTLDDVMAGPEAFQKFTADEIRQTFAKYYVPENRIEMSVVPEPSADAKPAGETPASK